MLQAGVTPLVYASRYDKWDVVKYLVEECNADVNGTDKVKQPTESNKLPVWFGG